MKMIEFTVRTATWKRDKNALRQVRKKVFIIEQEVPKSLEWDDEDTSACHVIAEDRQSRPIGTGRLLKNGQIGRMAVLRLWRGKGVGTAILSALLKQADHGPWKQLFLNAQTQAIDFYRKQGFFPVGDIFMEAGIEHIRMERSNGITD